MLAHSRPNLRRTADEQTLLHLHRTRSSLTTIGLPKAVWKTTTVHGHISLSGRSKTNKTRHRLAIFFEIARVGGCSYLFLRRALTSDGPRQGIQNPCATSSSNCPGYQVEVPKKKDMSSNDDKKKKAKD